MAQKKEEFLSDSDPRPKARAFLAAYRETGMLIDSAKAAGITLRCHYKWLAASNSGDRKYSDAFAEARKIAGDLYEAEAVRRAVEGYLEPVFYKGKPCGVKRKKSDYLLGMILSGLKPEYRSAKVEVTGKNGGPVQTDNNAINALVADHVRALREWRRSLGPEQGVVVDRENASGGPGETGPAEVRADPSPGNMDDLADPRG